MNLQLFSYFLYFGFFEAYDFIYHFGIKYIYFFFRNDSFQIIDNSILSDMIELNSIRILYMQIRIQLFQNQE